MEKTAELQKTKWAIDPMHSEVEFKIKHLMISTVTGTFKKFSGTINKQSEDFENADIQFSIDVNSISTNQETRDKHLKTAEFFDAEKYPKINFKSTSFKKVKEHNFTLIGNLTIKDITKPIELKVDFGGVAKDTQGNPKAGFEVTGTINRKDFGLMSDSLTDTGEMVLGDEVKLIANIQISKEKDN
jgi:polyisoprenoid-binding protein YceI